MEIFGLERSAPRIFLFALTTSVLCVPVLCDPAFGQPPAAEIKAVTSALSALAETDQQASFKKARDAINELIVADTSNNHFAHAVLIARLLIAVDKRTGLLASNESPDVFADLISLNGGNLVSSDSSFSFDTETPSRDDLRSAKDIELEKYLDKFGTKMNRGFFTYYRSHFAGDDDLKAIFEKATDDKDDQKRMFNRYLSEFKSLDKKYTVMRGKMRRK